MKITTVSSKKQITLSNEELIHLGVTPHGKVSIEKKGDFLVIKPIHGSVVEELAGSLTKFVPASKQGKSLDEIMEVTKKRVAKQLAENT